MVHFRAVNNYIYCMKCIHLLYCFGDCNLHLIQFRIFLQIILLKYLIYLNFNLFNYVMQVTRINLSNIFIFEFILNGPQVADRSYKIMILRCLPQMICTFECVIINMIQLFITRYGVSTRDVLCEVDFAVDEVLILLLSKLNRRVVETW